MDNSTKKLISGSMVYFVGNALTQFISLLLMRFVTGNITPEEYGYFNLITTISNLAIPFATLQIADAVYKFVLKSNSDEEKKTYFSICFLVSFLSIGIIIFATYGVSHFIVHVSHTFLVSLYLSSYSVFVLYQKITRCLNKSKVFVEGNLVKTVIFILLEILLISNFNMGIEALLIAHIVSMCFFLMYAELRVRALRYFDIHSLKIKDFLKMIRFSLPLMPNATFWWLTSSVNHVIVSSKLGVGVNGIYTVSGKFSGLLTTVTGVLNMSWQDTAISDYGNDKFGLFLTKTFNSFVKLIFSAIAVLIPLVFIALPYMVAPTYYDAINFVPFLLLCAGASSMSGFVAQIFTGKGKTQYILTTSICGMIANILVISVFINKLGLWAAVLGSLSSDVVLFVSRTFLARKEFAKGIDFVSFVIIFLLIVVGVFLYLYSTLLINILWFFVTAVLAVVLNRAFIKEFFSVIFGNFKN